jgi:uncharacterized membrane protein YraQ (UPF0718 family)
MFQAIFWGALLRFVQAFIQSTPTILVGLAVAAIFRRLLGHENTRRLFGCGTWREVPQAWLIGMLLPICSLGVIPVAREMRRARVAGGTILAFAITAPLFNPLSLLYGLTLSEPFVILSFAFCTLLVVSAVGLIWGWLFREVPHGEPAPAAVSYGLKRMMAILVAAAREVTGPSIGYVFIALLGVVALAIALPRGSLQATMEHTNPYAPLAMTVVAIPAYTPPLMAMSQIGSMFQHANSVGAAFVLLTLGAGINLGLIAWVFRNYGLARGFAWMGILLAVVIAIAYAIENPLFPDEIEPPGHTHAFDIYCRPFDAGASNLPATVVAKIKESLQPVERVGMIVLACLFTLGLTLRSLDRQWRIEDWLERASEQSARPAGKLDMAVPAAALGVVGLLGLVVFSIVGCYMYYPSPHETFEEMRILRAEVLTAANSGNKKHAAHFIPVWDEWTRKLQVGAFLREGSNSPYRRMKTKVFRDRLEFLKHAIEDDDKDEIRDYSAAVQNAYSRMRRVYLGG